MPPPDPAADPLAGVAALPGVSEAAARARAAVDGLLGHRALRRSLAAVAVECSLRAAAAAARLQAGPGPARLDAGLDAGVDAGLDAGVDAGVDAGLDAGLDDLRTAVRTGALFAPAAGPPGAGRATLRGAVRVSAETGSLLSVFERAPPQALARLHLAAAADVLAADRLGRPRGPGEEPADPLPLGPAPGPAEVSARLAALGRLLTAPTAAPAVVVAAVAHAEVLTLRPFGWGNVLVALAAQRLVLATRAVDPGGVSVPEAGHLEAGVDAYAEAARGYASGTADGVAGWVHHCARAVEVGAREGLAVCGDLSRR